MKEPEKSYLQNSECLYEGMKQTPNERSTSKIFMLVLPLGAVVVRMFFILYLFFSRRRLFCNRFLCVYAIWKFSRRIRQREICLCFVKPKMKI